MKKGQRDRKVDKVPRKLNLRQWKGRCKDSFAALGYAPRGKARVDRFIEDVRGR